MAKFVEYRKLVEKGMLSEDQYQKITGEIFNSGYRIPTRQADPELDKNNIQKEKNPPITVDEQKKINALEYTEYEGEGLKCPRYKKRVKQCPAGRIYDCRDYIKCEFAGAEIARSGGGGEVEPQEEAQPKSLIEHAAAKTGNSQMIAQANAIALIRLQRKQNLK